MSKGKTMTKRQEKICFVVGLVFLLSGLVCTVVMPYITDNSIFIQLGAVMFFAGLVCVVLMEGRKKKQNKNLPPRPRFKN